MGFYQGHTFEFIKAASDTVFNMINAFIVYHNKPLIFTGAIFREKLVSHHRAVNEADSCLYMRHAGLKVVTRTTECYFIGRLVNADNNEE